MRAPEIVDALGSNPLTGRAVTDRILSFLGVGPAEASSEISDEAAEAALRAALGDDLGDLARSLIREDEGEKTQDNIYALIQQMSIFQKVKLARLGNKEARGMLVRDRNKVVAIAAVTSPKLREDEAVNIAKSRSVCDEVLRLISINRQWTRSYQVKLALATNPRCSQVTAMQFINHLYDKDLRSIMKSKDVPATIASHARRALMRKGRL